MPSRRRRAHRRLADLDDRRAVRHVTLNAPRGAPKRSSRFPFGVRVHAQPGGHRPHAHDLETTSHREPARTGNRYPSDEAGVRRRRDDADRQFDSHKTTQRRTCRSEARVAAGGAERVTSALRVRASGQPTHHVRPRMRLSRRSTRGRSVRPDRRDGPGDPTVTGARLRSALTVDVRRQVSAQAPPVEDFGTMGARLQTSAGRERLRTSALQTRGSGPIDAPSWFQTSASRLSCGPRSYRLALADRATRPRDCGPQHRASAGDLCARDSRFRTGRCGLAVAELSIARRLGCTPRHHRHAPGQRSVGSRRRPPCDWHTDPDLGVGASGCGPQHRAQLCPARNARRTPETRTGVGYALAALATRTMTDRSPDPCARTSRRATGAPHGCAVASGNVIWPP